MTHLHDDNDTIMSNSSSDSIMSFSSSDEDDSSFPDLRITQDYWVWEDLASVSSLDDVGSDERRSFDHDHHHRSRWKLARLIAQSATTSTSDVGDIAKRAQRMIDNHAVYLFQKDSQGILPLHYALIVKAPLAIIKVLTEDYPDAITYGYEFASTSDGSYYLLRSAKYSALHIISKDKATMQYLIRRAVQYLQSPSSGSREKEIEDFFIHHLYRLDVCECFFEAFPDFLSRKSHFSSYERQRHEQSPEKELPLHFAVRISASYHVLQRMIQTYPQAVVEEGFDGKLPLHLVCSYRGPIQARVIKLLATPQAVRARDVSGMLPLHVLCYNSRQYPLDLDLVQALVNPYPESVGKLCSNGCTPIHSLCNRATVEELLVVCYMVEQCPDCLEIQVAGSQGETPLDLACAAFHDLTTTDLSVVRFLAQNYPDCVTFLDRSGYNPLQRACKNRNFHLIECLVEACPESIKDLDYNGRTSLHILCEGATDEDLATIEFLASKFPDLPTTKDMRGLTPLDEALQWLYLKKDEVVRYFVKQYPELLEPKSGGETTPLHNLCQSYDRNRLDISSYLEILSISEKAVTAKNRQGRTPLHSLCALGAPPHCQKILTDVSPSLVREADNDGRLPLHDAVEALVDAEHHLVTYRRPEVGDEGYVTDESMDPYYVSPHTKVYRCKDSVQFLLDQFPAAVTSLDNNGVNPLISACENDASIDLIYQLVCVNPIATLGIAA